MNAATFRRLALALPQATEVPHMERAAFRTARRIFATLAAGGASANLRLEIAEQDALVEVLPHAFAAVSGGWGKQGWTVVTLAKVSVDELTPVLADAHAHASASAKPSQTRKRR